MSTFGMRLLKYTHKDIPKLECASTELTAELNIKMVSECFAF